MPEHEVKWQLSGEYLEACNCDAGCPCKFGADPTQGNCSGILAFKVENGHYGSVELDGVSFVLLMYAPGSPFQGNLRTGCYVDEQANAEQREALGAILSGQAGGFWSFISTMVSDDKGTRYAPMEMQSQGDRRTFKIPGVLEIVNEPLTNPFTQEPQTVYVSNSFDPFCESGRAGRSVKAVCTDPNFEYELTGRQGYAGPFEWAGP